MLALAALHARVLLIDHVDAAMAAHHAAILVADLGGAQAVADLHDTTLLGPRGASLLVPRWGRGRGRADSLPRAALSSIGRSGSPDRMPAHEAEAKAAHQPNAEQPELG